MARTALRQRWAAVLAMLALMLCAAPSARAQTPTATVFIQARDQSGAALKDVFVTVTNQANGISRSGDTAADGTLAIAFLPGGTYTLTAALYNFRTEVIRDIHLQAAIKAVLTVTLTPGAYSDHVIVRADATTLRTGNSAVGQVFDSQTLLALPVNDRDPMQFTYQAPGVATPAPGSRLSTQGNIGLNSAGAREASNNFLLDGVDNNDLFLNRLVVNPSLDAIQEFSLLQNTYDAEYGRSAGAQMNVVVKSGTSQLRGSAYEFFQDSALNARNPLEPGDQPKALQRTHQVGGTLGGPLGHLPAFYFFNVEGVRGREADTRIAHVPTAAERAGDFSQSPGQIGGAPIVDPFTGQPFANNVIPSARLSPAGLRALALYPTPNRNDPDANFVASPVGTRDAIQFTIKTDQHFSTDSPFWVRYTFSRDNRALPFPAHERNLPGFGIAVLDQGHNFGAGVTRTFGAHLFNDLRIGLNALRRDNAPQRAGSNGFDALGITGPSLPGIDQAYPSLVVSGYETLGDDPNLPVLRNTRTWHLSDSLTIDRGKHHLKAGGEFRHYGSDGYNHLFARGQATFAGAYTGNPVADLLLGLPTYSLLAVNDNRQALRTWAANVFLQDDWRVSPTLTINAGIRYEYNAPPVDADNRMAIFDANTLRLTQVGTSGISRSGLRGDYNNVGPRVGVSWDLTGRGTLVLRGGYGLFYDSGTLIENSALYFNPPYFALQLFFPSQQQPLFLANPFPTGSGFTPEPTINTLDRNFRGAYSHQASIGLERTFAETTLTARYVTTHGEHMVRKRNINQPAPGSGDLDPRRPLQGFGDILLVESQASSSYHALQLSAVRRALHDLSFRAAYTFSKSMDDTSAFLATDGDDNTPQDSRNLAAEWGPSDFDVRHRLVVSLTYDVPKAGVSRLLRDWQISAIVTAQSGRPFTPRVSFDNSNTGNVGGGTFAYDRPNVLSTPPAAGVPYVTYDGRYFVVAPAGTFGDAGRNSLTGPGYASVDGVIARRISLAGRRALELRLEVFNALNRRNDTLPDSFVDRATFGQSLSAFPPRQFQLGARFSF